MPHLSVDKELLHPHKKPDISGSNKHQIQKHKL